MTGQYITQCSLRVLQKEEPDQIHTFIHLEAAQYNHSLICLPLSISSEVVGVKGLAQGKLSGGNEGGTRSRDLNQRLPLLFLLQYNLSCF